MRLEGRCHCFEDHVCVAIAFSGNSNIDTFGDDWKLRTDSVKLSEHNLFNSVHDSDANSFCWPFAFFDFLCDFCSFSRMVWRRGVIWLKWNRICWNDKRIIMHFSVKSYYTIAIRSMNKSIECAIQLFIRVFRNEISRNPLHGDGIWKWRKCLVIYSSNCDSLDCVLGAKTFFRMAARVGQRNVVENNG